MTLNFYTKNKESRMPTIGAAIKRIRQASDRRLMDVARDAGISVPLLSQIENGTRNPSIDVIERLAGALKIPVEALYLFAMPETLAMKCDDPRVSALTESLRRLAEAEAGLRDEMGKLDKSCL